jgi:hypothetical protein
MFEMATDNPLCEAELLDFNKAMEALKETHKHSSKPARIWEMSRCTQPPKDYVWENIDRICTSALMAGSNPVIKMANVGVADEIEQDALTS